MTNVATFPSVRNNVDFSKTFRLLGTGIGSASLLNGGSGYTTPPSVTFPAPPSGTGTAATGTATVVGGVVTGVTVTTPGEDYPVTTPPTLQNLTFSGGGGSGAAGTALPGNPLDLTGSTFFFMMRDDPSDPVVTLPLDSAGIGGIVISSPTSGAFAISIPRATLKKIGPGTYQHELIRLRPDGGEETVWYGTMTIVQGIYR